jgi:branched-chain amino acid aminotransferase
MNISVERIKQSKISSVDFKNLGFGNYISDHMLVANYKNSQWQQPQITPFGEIPMTPAILSLHYGQSVFEGMKAFKNKKARFLFLDRSVTIKDCSVRLSACVCPPSAKHCLLIVCVP